MYICINKMYIYEMYINKIYNIYKFLDTNSRGIMALFC